MTTLLLDQGSNFKSTELKQYCQDVGTQLQFSPVDTPEPNGRIERLHQTLVDDVRCMLLQSGLPLTYWPFAMDYATYVRNMTPVAGLDRVPQHIWTGRKPNVAHLRVFGETCFPRIPNKDQQSKLLPRATRAIFVGFDEQTRTYRCLDSSTNGLILAPHVQFMMRPELPNVNTSRYSDESYLFTAQDPDTELPTNPQSRNPHPDLIDSSIHRHKEETTRMTSESNEADESSDDDYYSADDYSSTTTTTEDIPTNDSSTGDAMRTEENNRQENEDDNQPQSDMESDQEIEFHSSSHGKYVYQNMDKKAAKDINSGPLHSKRTPKPRSLLAKPDGSILNTPVSYHTSLPPLGSVSQLISPPNHYRDIAGRPDAEEWYAASQREIQGLKEKQYIRKLIPRSEVPAGALIYKSRYQFRRKPTGLAKARWCIRGDMQKRHNAKIGVDEIKITYAPVGDNASFKVLCAIVAHEDLEFENIDINQAFTCAKHPGTVYVEQPEGFLEQGKEDWIIILEVAMYGLPEAPLLWNEELDAYLQSLRFIPSPADPCLYIRGSGDEKMMILIHDDDLAIAAKDKKQISEFKDLLNQKYGIKDLGPITRYTSYQLNRDRESKTLTLHQYDYISELLQFANMGTCIPLDNIPATFNHLSSEDSPKTEKERETMRRIPYREVVGALLHLSNRTRPDIAHAVSVLTRFCHNPGPTHWTAAKQVLRYLKATSRLGLTLGGREDLYLVAYVDANYGQDSDSRRSTTGYAFLFGNAAISTKSKLQPTVATSSCEAELGALFLASSEAVWIRRLLHSVGYPCQGPTVLNEDNQAAIKYAQSREAYGRMKHIDLKYMFIREQIQKGVIALKFVKSSDNCADTFTKALPKPIMKNHRTMLGLKDSSRGGEC